MSGTLLTPKIFAFIQARTDSTRLPGKVLKEFPSGSGKTILDRIQDRMLTLLPEERIFYLIPENDDRLRSFLKERKYNFISGSLLDVRERYLKAAQTLQAEWILRLTGDNPFYDTLHLDQLLQTFQYSKPDLAHVVNLPLGMGGEIFTREALDWTPNILEERHREHVSLHIKENPDRFRILKLAPLLNEEEQKILPNLRLTIDEPKDFETTSLVFRKLNDQNPFFGAKEVIRLFREVPEVFEGNREVEQIRFETPKERNSSRKTIGILAGDPVLFGSGHFERSRILFSLLSSEGFHSSWRNEFPKDGDLDLLVVDSRDIRIPEYSKTKIFLLDHFGSDRKKYSHFEILPHPEIKKTFSLDQILIPPRLRSLDTKNGSYILCYAGNLELRFVSVLDSFLETMRAKEEFSKVIRIGGVNSDLDTIEVLSRVSAFSFQTLLAESGAFIGYFGQSLFEAVFFGKKVASFSIGPVHSALSLLSEEEYKIPFLGELGSSDFGKKFELNKSSQPVSGKGYSILLSEIKKFLLL
ncbi:cytidylyltransferase domain-containing protein [Leptospira adleri]|uniref:Spore coat biosynthesis protein F n=1 Tax=Leptospira adleri TaxID=2023186 RepID=A0A2M9YQP8_9LEPT|nr:spore coat biosynthesis protein F [Leptospira adleri]PJZ53868.1 spore coat biosynthesis protein F [Leptospira adleri]PJZ63114.1 spore coat biosynthesis protein F [Leptospira adleri]